MADPSKSPALVIAVSSRALFHIEDGDRIFQTEGQEAFDRYMLEKEDEPLRPGSAFPVIRKFLALNPPDGPPVVRAVLLSRNSPEAGCRIMKSVEHYQLPLESAIFSRGTDRFRYASAIGAHLFLSANQADVKRALQHGMAAATIVPSVRPDLDDGNELRLAFDGDSVIFDSESDDHYRRHGIDGFMRHERDQVDVPLAPGPFKVLLEMLHRVQRTYPSGECPLKVGLFTARGLQAHRRVMSTLRQWGITLDEAAWASGAPKGPLVKAFRASLFFDDSFGNIESAVSHDVPAGHVPVSDQEGIVGHHSTGLLATA